MASRVTSYPALGQTTVVSETSVNITVAIDAVESAWDQIWEVVLWHNGNGSQEWAALELIATDTPLPFTSCGANIAETRIKYFTGSFDRNCPGAKQVYFTVKYRIEGSEWRWVNDQFSLEDGEIRFQEQGRLPGNDLSTYIGNLSPGVCVKSQLGHIADTSLWEISIFTKGADGSQCGLQNVLLGLPRDFTHWFSLVRHSTPWLAPRQGKRKFTPVEDVIFCSFLREDGIHLVLLAVTRGHILTCFKSDENGNVLISSKNDSVEEGRSCVVAAAGKNFEDANAAAMSFARRLIQESNNTPGILLGEYTETTAEAGPGSKELYDGLTFCTWNSLGQQLSEEKIINAIDMLTGHDVYVTNLLVDDNWQSLDNSGASQFERGWTDFEANPENFPGGLKGLTTGLRAKNKHLKHIGVWHGVFGYWGGVSPTGNLARKYRTKQVRKERDFYSKDTITIFDGEDIVQVYDDFYKFLKESGITVVKSDTRYLLDCLTSADDRASLIWRYNHAWLAASRTHLSMNVVSCMSLIPQLIFSPELFDPSLQKFPPIVLRNSDDFFPDDPASHTWHIFWNAHNAILTQHLHAVPDWDMFQTVHEFSGFHAAGRCVSGGPIWITDEPGQHNLDLIAQFTARHPNGNNIALRPGVVGRSMQIYTEHREQRFCKVGSYHRLSTTSDGGLDNPTGVSILGIFNMREGIQAEFLSLSDFLEITDDEKQEYIIRVHGTSQILGPITGTDSTPFLLLELGFAGYEIISAYPLRPLSISGSGEGNKFAVLGLLGKMTGAAAVTAMGIDIAGRPNLKIVLKALGVLGILIVGPRNRVLSKGNELDASVDVSVTGRYVSSSYLAQSVIAIGVILEIDLESALKDIQVPWPSEEIEVTIRL